MIIIYSIKYFFIKLYYIMDFYKKYKKYKQKYINEKYKQKSGDNFKIKKKKNNNR